MRRPEPKNIRWRTKRAVARLDSPLEKRLLSYVAAASAAGVGTLCCTPQAQAKVVFTDTWIPISPVASVNLDLNNDGITDFQISNTNNKCGHHSSYKQCATLKVLPKNASNAVWGTNGSASALGSGVSLGSQGKFQTGHEFMGGEFDSGRNLSSQRYGSTGPWTQTTRGFLGLKFIIQGQVHFGWARLSVSATLGGIYAAISGYAYETEPNKPILTGQENGGVRKGPKAKIRGVRSGPRAVSGSLGMLAGGAPALPASRKADVMPQ